VPSLGAFWKHDPPRSREMRGRRASSSAFAFSLFAAAPRLPYPLHSRRARAFAVVPVTAHPRPCHGTGGTQGRPVRQLRRRRVGGGGRREWRGQGGARSRRISFLFLETFLWWRDAARGTRARCRAYVSSPPLRITDPSPPPLFTVSTDLRRFRAFREPAPGAGQQRDAVQRVAAKRWSARNDAYARSVS
jgi:hypothetical protein